MCVYSLFKRKTESLPQKHLYAFLHSVGDTKSLTYSIVLGMEGPRPLAWNGHAHLPSLIPYSLFLQLSSNAATLACQFSSATFLWASGPFHKLFFLPHSFLLATSPFPFFASKFQFSALNYFFGEGFLTASPMPIRLGQSPRRALQQQTLMKITMKCS